MGKRVFSREFKLEAVRLVRERGVAKSQAARELGIHVNVLRKWIRDYEADPKQNPGARFIPEIGASELERRALPSLPFDRVLLKLLGTARLLKRFQVINGHKPKTIEAALRGEHVGTIVHAD